MSSIPRILVTESHDYSPEALAILRSVGEVTVADMDREALMRLAPSHHALIVRLRHHVNEEVFAAAPELRCVASATTGLNHIDLEAAARRDIAVISLRGEVDFLQNIRATAEHTLALTLALLRQIAGAFANALTGDWRRDDYRGHELYNKTVGIIGYGRLGRIIAGYFAAFGARVLTTDPNVGSDCVEPGVSWTSLEDLLARSDIISLHVNYDATTEGFFDAKCFQLLKQGAFFINTSRGELVDEDALLSALHNDALAGAALDVISGELSGSKANHPLISYARAHNNLLLTPHIGGNTHESLALTEVFIAEKVRQYFQSGLQLYRNTSKFKSLSKDFRLS